VVGDVIEIGRRLSECKRICGHGNWLPWLKREFGWSEDTAERFIQVSALSNQIPQVAEFRLPISALYRFAAPSTPETARTEIIERAQSGEMISFSEVKCIIDAARLPGPKKANQLAKEEGRPVFASDGYIYFGTDPELAKEGEDRRTMVYGVRRALDTLGNIQLTGRQFLDYALPHQLWDENEAKIIKQALRWLTSLAEAWDPDSASEADRLRALCEELDHDYKQLWQEHLALTARSEELKYKHHRLERENPALRSEVDELKAELAKRAPVDDGLDIPANLRRAAPAPATERGSG